MICSRNKLKYTYTYTHIRNTYIRTHTDQAHMHSLRHRMLIHTYRERKRDQAHMHFLLCSKIILTHTQYTHTHTRNTHTHARAHTHTHTHTHRSSATYISCVATSLWTTHCSSAYTSASAPQHHKKKKPYKRRKNDDRVANSTQQTPAITDSVQGSVCLSVRLSTSFKVKK